MIRYFTICFILVNAVASAQSSVDYSKFKGVNVRASMEARLDKPYFKRYGNPGRSEYVVVNVNTPSGNPDEPEYTLWQIFRATSNDAAKQYLTNGYKPASKRYKNAFNLNADTTRNFIVLRHKLTFSIGDQQELAVIKYTQFVDSVRVGDFSMQVMLAADKKWKATDQKKYSDVEYAIANITEAYFWSLSKKAKLAESDKPVEQAVLTSIKDDEGYLNLTKLAQYIRQQTKGNKSPFSE